MALGRAKIRRWNRCFRWFQGDGFAPEKATFYEFLGARGMDHSPEEAKPPSAYLDGALVFLPHQENGPRHVVEAAFSLLGIYWRGASQSWLNTEGLPHFPDLSGQRAAFDDVKRRIQKEVSDTYDHRYEFELIEMKAARLRMLSMLTTFSHMDALEVDGVWSWSRLLANGSEFTPQVFVNGKPAAAASFALSTGTPREGEGLVVCDAWDFRAVVGEFQKGYALTLHSASH